MVDMLSFTSLTVLEMEFVDSTTSLIFRWISSTVVSMLLVATAVCFASSFTELATTAKPRPASPARADSIVAFKGEKVRLICKFLNDFYDLANQAA